MSLSWTNMQTVLMMEKLDYIQYSQSYTVGFVSAQTVYWESPILSGSKAFEWRRKKPGYKHCQVQKQLWR